MTVVYVTAFALMFSYLSINICTAEDECLTPHEINNWKRSAAHDTTANDFLCDKFLDKQWYRIRGEAGERMPTECLITSFKCGTGTPFWLSRYGLNENEPVFPNNGEKVDRTACGSHFLYGCCHQNVSIQIKNCTDHLVYFLGPTPSCPSGYCFGDKVPCPPGQYSESGFTPGCGNYPKVTINPKPTVITGLHRTEIDDRISEKVKFQCSAIIDPAYTLDVHWYINGEEIPGAYYKNITPYQLNDALLHQHHWEKNYKLNMDVSCAISLRQAGYDSPSPPQFSDDFVAGLFVDYKDEHRVLVENGEAKNIPAKLTIPVGCMWRKNKSSDRSYCAVTIFGAIPVHQTKICNQNSINGGLSFTSQQCAIFFNYTHWNHTNMISVAAPSDNMVNFGPRIMFLRLYTNEIPVKELEIWRDFLYPDLSFSVHDSDFETYDAVCSSDNDPHMTTFDRTTYSFHRTPGEYILYKHDKFPVEIHARYAKCDYYLKTGGGALCNCGAAIRSGDSVFVANFCPSEEYSNTYVIQKICDEQDLKVTGKNHKYTIITMSGTQVDLTFGEVTLPNEDFFGIQTFDITPSGLDKHLTSGLCGSFNKYPHDDFKPKGQTKQINNQEEFAEYYRLKSTNDSLFNINNIKFLPGIEQRYCTCTTERNRYPYGDPNFVCDITSAESCSKITVTNKVYNAPCKQKSFRKKRDLYKANLDELHSRDKREIQSSSTSGEVIELGDDDAPIMFAMNVTERIGDRPDLTWKNSWTEEKARLHCTDAFQNSASFTICKEYVPTIPADDYIENCVADIRLTGHTNWAPVSVNNFATVCLHVASKLENLTVTNGTSFSGDEKSIFEIIQESTCPFNCSGNGNCIEGQCICKDPYFGPACKTEKTQAPKISKRSFRGLCDTSFKPCHKYIISGYNFREGSLTCRYKQFTITLNESSKTGVSESSEGIYLNPFSVQCPAPLSRHRRSVIGQKSSAFGYFISVSNDGKNFTEDLTIIIYDSNCFECSTENMTCFQVASCPQETDEEDDNKLMTGMYIAIALGILTAVTVVITILLYLKKKKSKGNESGSNHGHCPTNHTSRPPTNHRFTLPKDWIKERRDYYGPQHSSALPAIRGKEKICNDL